jgi:hypothetical protein
MAKSNKKRLYCLVDTETTKHNGLVFDFAYNFRDRQGYSYAKNSFLFKDVLAIEDPFYKEKIAEYWTLVWKHKIKPVTVKVARRHFNFMVEQFQKKNYEIVICAYNAAFDIRVLGETSRDKVGVPWLTKDVANNGVKMFDLWHGWVMGCPKDYGETAAMSDKGNIRTSAEEVFRYESKNPSFVERHVAFSDIIIEDIILSKILARKKKLHIVDNPKLFAAHPWKIAQERCRAAIEYRKQKQLSMQTVIETIGLETISKDHRIKQSMVDRVEDTSLYNLPEIGD